MKRGEIAKLSERSSGGRRREKKGRRRGEEERQQWGWRVGFCIPGRAQRDQPPKSIGTKAKKAGPFFLFFSFNFQVFPKIGVGGETEMKDSKSRSGTAVCLVR